MNPEDFSQKKAITAANDICGPVFVPTGKKLLFTLTDTNSLVGTVGLYINITVPDDAVPATNDAGWTLVEAYTAETAKLSEANAWFMAECTAYTSGDGVAALKAK